MANNLAELEDQIAEKGFTRETLLGFLRLLPNNDPAAIKPTLTYYANQLREAGVEVDEDLFDRVMEELELYGRIQPETVIGAPPRPQISLRSDND